MRQFFLDTNLGNSEIVMFLKQFLTLYESEVS